MNGEWVPLDQFVAYRWDLAEIRRMQRTQDETDALHQLIARNLVRRILRRLINR